MLLLCVCSSRPTAFAQSPAPGRPVAAADPVQASFDKGVAFAKQRRWVEARAAFLQAWAVEHAWWIAANLGHCEMKLGRYADAATHYAYYLREAPAEWKDKAKALLDKVLAKVGMLHVQADRAGADVLLDGVLVGKSPLDEPLFVLPGKHTLQMRVAYEVLAEQSVDATAGGSYNVMLAAPPLQLAQSQQNQQPQGSATSASPTTPSASAAPDTVTAEPKRPASSFRPHPAWIIAGGVLSLGAVGAGIGLTVAANGKSAEAAEIEQRHQSDSACYKQTGVSIPSDCGAQKRAVDDKYTFTRAAQASFIVGGTVALATVGLGVWTIVSSKKAEPQIRVAPAVGRGHGAVVLMGTW